MNRRTIALYIFLLLLIPISYILLTDPANVGPLENQEVPETVLPDTADQIIDLASVRGSMVLVNFWASWCRPCRDKNPEITQLYSRFHDKSFENGDGFEVFSISLDRNKDAWIKAINDDQLVWPWHGSNLMRFEDELVEQYGVNSIPISFIIDGNGKLVKRTSNMNEVAEILEAQML